MPVNARGIVCDTEQRMLDYYFTYLDLFRSLQQRGYAYRGEDEICFGVTAEGGIVHMRRGTHRLASAHFLKLPFVTGLVTHADPAWVEQARAAQRGWTARRHCAIAARIPGPSSRPSGGRSDGGAMKAIGEIFRLFFYTGWKRQCLILLAMLLGVAAENLSIASLWPIVGVASGEGIKPSPATEVVTPAARTVGLSPTLGALLLFLCVTITLKFALSSAAASSMSAREVARMSTHMRAAPDRGHRARALVAHHQHAGRAPVGGAERRGGAGAGGLSRLRQFRGRGSPKR